MNANCPKCRRPIYNRKHKLCGFCGAALPPELLFSEAELAALKKQDEESEARRKNQRSKDEAEEANRREKAAWRAMP